MSNSLRNQTKILILVRHVRGHDGHPIILSADMTDISVMFIYVRARDRMLIPIYSTRHTKCSVLILLKFKLIITVKVNLFTGY